MFRKKEQELVNENVVEDSNSYNRIIGGIGGRIPGTATRAKMKLAWKKRARGPGPGARCAKRPNKECENHSSNFMRLKKDKGKRKISVGAAKDINFPMYLGRKCLKPLLIELARPDY